MKGCTLSASLASNYSVHSTHTVLWLDARRRPHRKSFGPRPPPLAPMQIAHNSLSRLRAPSLDFSRVVFKRERPVNHLTFPVVGSSPGSMKLTTVSFPLFALASPRDVLCGRWKKKNSRSTSPAKRRWRRGTARSKPRIHGLIEGSTRPWGRCSGVGETKTTRNECGQLDS